MGNFKEISRRVLEQQAAIQCVSPDEVTKTLLDLYQHKDLRLGLVERGKQFIEQNQGAINRLYEKLSVHF